MRIGNLIRLTFPGVTVCLRVFRLLNETWELSLSEWGALFISWCVSVLLFRLSAAILAEVLYSKTQLIETTKDSKPFKTRTRWRRKIIGAGNNWKPKKVHLLTCPGIQVKPPSSKAQGTVFKTKLGWQHENGKSPRDHGWSSLNWF